MPQNQQTNLDLRACWCIAPAIDIGYVLFCCVAFCLSWLGFMFGLPWGVPFGVLVGVVGGLPWLGLLAAYILCCGAVFCLSWLGFVCVWLAMG